MGGPSSNGFIALLVWLASLLFGGFMTLSTLVLCVAGMANSNDQQMRQMKLLMLGIGAFGLGCIVAAVLLMLTGHAWWGAGVGLLPTAVLIVLIAFNA
jgi:hypothetical protein